MIFYIFLILFLGCTDIYLDIDLEEDDPFDIAEDRGSPLPDSVTGLDCLDGPDSLCTEYLSNRYRTICMRYHDCMLSRPDIFDYRPHICEYITGETGCSWDFEAWLCCIDNCHPVRKLILQDTVCDYVEDRTVLYTGGPVAL